MKPLIGKPCSCANTDRPYRTPYTHDLAKSIMAMQIA